MGNRALPTVDSAARLFPNVLGKEREDSGASYRCILACESQQACVAVAPEQRNGVAFLIAYIEEIPARVDAEMAGIVAQG
jgi:hypothetical protein